LSTCYGKAKLADLTAAAAELDALAEAHGLEVSLPALEALACDESDPEDSEAIDAARAELRDVLGIIHRGEYPTETTTEGEATS